MQRKAKTLSRLLCAILAMDLSAAYAAAPACNANEILRNNVESYQSNLVVWLSYISNLIQDRKSSSSSSAGISYAGIALNLDDARSMSEYISQQKNYTLSQQQSVSILRSTLSPDSVKAYIACIGANRGLSIVIPADALDESSFPFEVYWDPSYSPKGKLLVMKVINGKIDGESKVTIQQNPAKIVFQVDRFRLIGT